MTRTGEISFFELGAPDADKGRAFYETLFGWRFAQGPSGAGWTIETPNVSGGKHPGDYSGVGYLFVAVDDLDAASAEVTRLGGEVLDVDVSGDAEGQARFGRFKLCKDDQGSPFGLHQRRSGA